MLGLLRRIHHRMLAALMVTLLRARWAEVTRRPDRGMETLEFVLWAAGIIVIIGVLLTLVGDKLETFWNSIDFGSVI